ncbi:MAG TPA: tetratricopeptide repeat protein [Mycobacteriales bacterium]|nr:tetratricopeptide repeat protein [Mycobacteriales bacterium]
MSVQLAGALRRPAIGIAVAIAVAPLAAGCGGGSSEGGGGTPASNLAAGLQAEHAGNQTVARELFEKVLAADPSNVYAHFDLGVIEQQANNTQAALADYGAALTANPNFVPALYNEATIYSSSDPSLAITVYQKVRRLQPSASDAALNLGLLEAQAGQLKAAARDLTDAVRLDPSLAGRIPKSVSAQAKIDPSKIAAANPSPTASPS